MLREVAVIAVIGCGAYGKTLDALQPQQQGAGAVVRTLKTRAAGLLDPSPQVWLSAKDGLVFSWNVNLGGNTHLPSVIRAVNGSPQDPCGAVDAWCERAVQEIVQMTAEEVARAGSDPDFNANTDVRVHFIVNNFPSDAPCVRKTETPDFVARGGPVATTHSFSRSYIGVRPRRDPGRDRSGEVQFVGPDQITVTVTPDREVWGYRQTITGDLSIVNTGAGRVPLATAWIDNVRATTAAGEEAPTFSIMGNVSPDPRRPSFVFLKPGEKYTGRFKVFTDRSYSMEHGHYMDPGTWHLTYGLDAAEGVDVRQTAAVIEVRAQPGEYTAPRIGGVVPAGSNLLLVREHGITEVVDVASSARVKTPHLSDGYNAFWVDATARPVSPDGQLAAYAKAREGPIRFEALKDGVAIPPDIPAPPSYDPVENRFRPVRFSADGSSLLCVSAGWCHVYQVATGALDRSFSLSEKWMELSPDGGFAAALAGTRTARSGRGSDRCNLVLQRTGEGGNIRTVAITGRGETPDIAMGRAGVYLVDEFNDSALYVPFDGTPMRTFQVGSGAEFIGESADGTLCAFISPRLHRAAPPVDRRIVTIDVTTGSRLSSIGGDAPLAAVLVESPLRIVCLPMQHVPDEGGAGWTWLKEVAEVYDARTGGHVSTVDLTPPAGSIPAHAARKCGR